MQRQHLHLVGVAVEAERSQQGRRRVERGVRVEAGGDQQVAHGRGGVERRREPLGAPAGAVEQQLERDRLGLLLLRVALRDRARIERALPRLGGGAEGADDDERDEDTSHGP